MSMHDKPIVIDLTNDTYNKYDNYTPSCYIDVQSWQKYKNNKVIANMSNSLKMPKSSMVALYLDAERINTTRSLIGHGLSPNNLHSPNIDATTRAILSAASVHTSAASVHTSAALIQDYLPLLIGRKIWPHIYYFDFQETLLGNATIPQLSPFATLLRVLKSCPHNQIVFAITFNRRSGGFGRGYDVLGISNKLIESAIEDAGWRINLANRPNYTRERSHMAFRAYALERIARMPQSRNFTFARTKFRHVNRKIARILQFI